MPSAALLTRRPELGVHGCAGRTERTGTAVSPVERDLFVGQSRDGYEAKSAGPEGGRVARRPSLTSLLSVAAGLGWLCAAHRILMRSHYVFGYHARPAARTPATGVLLAAGLAVAVGVGAHGEARRRGRLCGRSHLWLYATLGIPLLAAVRHAVPSLPVTFIELFGFVYATGAAAYCMPASGLNGDTSRKGHAWAESLVWAATLGFVVFAVVQGCRAYSDYLLGYADFGHFARRVVNTWSGRGILRQSPSLPVFWDHFNPGLLLLTPLWALCPDARLFVAVQALCLGLPAVMIYRLAKRVGADPWSASAWAVAYLLSPPVSQLNLSFSYGWHPVSLALPILFASLLCLACGRPGWALGFALLACSFKENVFVVVASFALVMAWIARRSRGGQGDFGGRDVAGHRLTVGISMRAWLAAAGLSVAALAVVCWMLDFSSYQVGRFDELGGTAGAILLSPVTKPAAFWGPILSRDSLYYVLALAVPLGVSAVTRGWRLALAGALPLGVLLAWQHKGATCIAFQYVTTLLPVAWIAALMGAERRSRGMETATGLRRHGACALAGCAAASLALSAFPWAPVNTYYNVPPPHRAVWRARARVLDSVAARLNSPDVTVIATSRLAPHLLEAAGLEVVNEMLRGPIGALADAGLPADEALRRRIAAFDYIAMDLHDLEFQQNMDDISRLAQAAEEEGYRLVEATWGTLVYRSPTSQTPRGFGDSDILGQMRLPRDAAEAVGGLSVPVHVARGLEIVSWHIEAGDSPTRAEQTARMRIVWRASADAPGPYMFRLTTTGADGTPITDWGGLRAPLDGNRPTRWWTKGEAYRETIEAEDVEAMHLVGEGVHHRIELMRTGRDGRALRAPPTVTTLSNTTR